MSLSNSQKPFGTTNELAKERNRAAAERTLNAWIRNCLGLIWFGVAFDQIAQRLRERFPEAKIAIAENISHLIGIGFIAVGIILLIIALMQHRIQITSIEREDYVLLSVSNLNRIVVIGIVLLGVVVLFSTLFLLG
jgi:putative membrane protein